MVTTCSSLLVSGSLLAFILDSVSLPTPNLHQRQCQCLYQHPYTNNTLLWFGLFANETTTHPLTHSLTKMLKSSFSTRRSSTFGLSPYSSVASAMFAGLMSAAIIRFTPYRIMSDKRSNDWCHKGSQELSKCQCQCQCHCLLTQMRMGT